MKEILFATGNVAKVKRFYDKLLENNIKMYSLNDIEEKIEVEEDGKTAIENALIKARAYKNITNMPIMAIDDTLYLEGVPNDVMPGVYVRRLNGIRLSDEEMIDYYVNLVKKYGVDGKIKAKWVYGLAIINNNQEYTYTWNTEEFYLVDKPSKKIERGYPLNSVSIDYTGKYFTDKVSSSITHDDKVIEFIIENIWR